MADSIYTSIRETIGMMLEHPPWDLESAAYFRHQRTLARKGKQEIENRRIRERKLALKLKEPEPELLMDVL